MLSLLTVAFNALAQTTPVPGKQPAKAPAQAAPTRPTGAINQPASTTNPAAGDPAASELERELNQRRTRPNRLGPTPAQPIQTPVSRAPRTDSIRTADSLRVAARESARLDSIRLVNQAFDERRTIIIPRLRPRLALAGQRRLTNTLASATVRSLPKPVFVAPPVRIATRDSVRRAPPESPPVKPETASPAVTQTTMAKPDVVRPGVARPGVARRDSVQRNLPTIKMPSVVTVPSAKTSAVATVPPRSLTTSTGKPNPVTPVVAVPKPQKQLSRPAIAVTPPAPEPPSSAPFGPVLFHQM